MIANFIGGVTIYLSQPFSVGDWIHSERRQDGTSKWYPALIVDYRPDAAEVRRLASHS